MLPCATRYRLEFDHWIAYQGGLNMAEEQAAEAPTNTGLEIVSRICKIILFIGTLFNWGLSLLDFVHSDRVTKSA
jgi:hypothetical protein